MTTPDPLEAIEVVRGLLREHHSVAMQRMADKLSDALRALLAERDELAKAREENVRLLAGLQGAAAAFEQAATEPRALFPQPEEREGSDAE
jgi:pyruvate/oxaloacetate carboxyltransferase